MVGSVIFFISARVTFRPFKVIHRSLIDRDIVVLCS